MGSGSVRSSHQTVSDYTLRNVNDFQTTQCRFLTACRGLEKLVLLSTLDTSPSSSMTWNLQSYPATVLIERLWHLWRESKHTLTPPTYFQGSRHPTPDLRFWLYITSISGAQMHMTGRNYGEGVSILVSLAPYLGTCLLPTAIDAMPQTFLWQVTQIICLLI